MQLASNLTHTAAIASTLRTAGLRVGEGVATISKHGTGPLMQVPYVIVDDFASGEMSGPVGAHHDDATLVYQVRCVGKSQEQALWLVDRVREVLLAGVSVNGRRVFMRPNPGSAGPHVDNDVQPPVFVAYPMFRALSTPS